MTAAAAPSQIKIQPHELPAGELDSGKLRGYQRFRYTTMGKLREHQHFWYTVLGLGLAVSAYFAAWGLHGNSSSTYRIGNQWSALTGLFILALAIERALEPFSRKLGPDTTKAKAVLGRSAGHRPCHWRRH
jgi:hypothetical protein